MQGVTSADYGLLAAKAVRGVTAYSATGTALSVVSGRVSYVMRLKGPAVTVDTACSSSLVSLHLAFNALLAGQASLAFNSGVNLTLVPETPAMFQRAGMMTPDGRCKTLDGAADGYVRGEAVVTALLRCLAGGDESCVLLHGTAVNQGGRSSTLTAPNGPSQQDVIRNALRSGGVAPHTLAGLQMHGTGTPLGDPIEVGAAAAVLVEGHVAQRAQQPLALMASKSWLGHAEPAAGMVGLAHAAAALGHAALLGISHLRELNPYVVTSLKVAGALSGLPQSAAAGTDGLRAARAAGFAPCRGHVSTAFASCATAAASCFYGKFECAWCSSAFALTCRPVLHLLQGKPSPPGCCPARRLCWAPAARHPCAASAPSPFRAPTRTLLCSPPHASQPLDPRWRRHGSEGTTGCRCRRIFCCTAPSAWWTRRRCSNARWVRRQNWRTSGITR